tara:strand:+ start:69 stop:350 length:282 start_codon:yes stop_codon:yes gene_type:complete
MIRLVFASCLLLILSSCSGIAGLALSAASSAKTAYDGITYADEKGWLDYNKGPIRENTWYQIHDDGIWFGDYFQYERRNYRIYGNPRDKEKYK